MWGACQHENHAVSSARGESCGYLHLRNPGLGSAGEVLALCTTEGWSCCPQLPGSLTGKGSFLLSHYRIWERPWRGIPPSRYAKMLNDLPGETQLVTGSGLILSLCLTDFTFLGYLRKTSTAQSCWWPHPALCGCISSIGPRS